VNEAGDQFGAALAVGDFNGDRVKDLAVGAPGDGVGGVKAGSVFIFTGSAAGITAGPFVVINHTTMKDPVDVLDVQPLAAGDQFGAALAVGDFNADMIDELLVGAPGKAGIPAEDAKGGTVTVFAGSLGGIKPGDFFTQQGRGGSVEAGDQFGAALAVGDFNGDTFVEAAVGAPGEAFGAGPQSGAVSFGGYGDINLLVK
jgi:hypothetical protein